MANVSTLPLTARTIRLGARVADKAAAIRAVADVLAQNGNIDPAYAESMLAREAQADTCLGHGVAIPHGQPEARGLIRETGIAVLQVPEGVAWNAGQTVRLVVGIAARADEHLAILAALTGLLDDEAGLEKLATTTDPADILAALTGLAPAQGDAGAAAGAPAQVEPWPGALQTHAVIAGHAGLHARPAARLAEIAADFAAELRVIRGSVVANAKSMASLLRLGASQGEKLLLEARGADADAALRVLVAAIEDGLGDAEENAEPVLSPSWTPPETITTMISGVAASPGLAIGTVFRFRSEMLVVKDVSKEPAAERRKLGQMLAAADAELATLAAEAEGAPLAMQAEIFAAHRALLADAELRAEVEALIDAGHGAAWSWQEVIARHVDAVRQLDDARLAGRATDLRDIGQRVLRLFAGVSAREPILPDRPCILVDEDLTPSDTAGLDPEKILGICTAAGGPTSHTAIIARARGIPAVVGAGEKALALADGTTVILDGGAGRLYPQPDEGALASARAFQANWQQALAATDAARYRPALLEDGHRIEVVANIGHAEEALAAVKAGAEGVGLLRTEFLFLGRQSAPTESEQFLAYTQMLRALDGLPLIIRTLDIGGDKQVPYLGMQAEENPFLGIRGVRLCLRRPEVFRTQLRAIYRAAATAAADAVKIMFPMVTTLEDLRAARALAEEVRASLGAPVVQIGIMVEVPSVVMMAREFAREADFFSIGTNDLTQYGLAIDRQHPELGKEADALHPAVLRMIARVTEAAVAEGKWVGVCGAAAGEPFGATLFAGLGVTELSMSAPSVSTVKAALRRTSLPRAQALARQALAASSASEVRALWRG